MANTKSTLRDNKKAKIFVIAAFVFVAIILIAGIASNKKDDDKSAQKDNGSTSETADLDSAIETKCEDEAIAKTSGGKYQIVSLKYDQNRYHTNFGKDSTGNQIRQYSWVGYNKDIEDKASFACYTTGETKDDIKILYLQVDNNALSGTLDAINGE